MAMDAPASWCAVSKEMTPWGRGYLWLFSPGNRHFVLRQSFKKKKITRCKQQAQTFTDGDKRHVATNHGGGRDHREQINQKSDSFDRFSGSLALSAKMQQFAKFFIKNERIIL
ncbi:hypothetical protein [Bartonella sp. LJL80]